MSSVVEGPIAPTSGTRGRPFLALPPTQDLRGRGYVEEEFLFSGTARGASKPASEEVDGPFTSRMLVRRPADAARASGTVVVEWLNVSAGLDAGVDWSLLEGRLVDDGDAWVGVTAQPHGVEHLRLWDPDRYARLAHPGRPDGDLPQFLFEETFSFAVYEAALQAVREEPALLGGRAASQVIAVGTSQSAMRLTEWIRRSDNVSRLVDALLIHVGGDSVVDCERPVLKINSENEVLRFFPLRADNPDRDRFRYWEIAGAGHGSTLGPIVEILEHGLGGTFTSSLRSGEPAYPDSSGAMPQEYVARAGYAHLKRWAAGGEPPPHAPLVEVEPGPPPAIVRDERGNACGGIRLPQIEAPIARFMPNTPQSPTSGGVDWFTGDPAGTTPDDEWDEPKLRDLYPDHDAYVAQFRDAAERLVAAGFLLPGDADTLVTEAESADVPD